MHSCLLRLIHINKYMFLQGKGKTVEIYRLSTAAEVEMKLKRKAKRARKTKRKNKSDQESECMQSCLIFLYVLCNPCSTNSFALRSCCFDKKLDFTATSLAFTSLDMVIYVYHYPFTFEPGFFWSNDALEISSILSDENR